MATATAALALSGAAAIGLALLSPGRPAGAPALATWRRKLLDCARWHVDNRTLYQWGGGHGWLGGAEYGLDCSGLVLECGRKAGVDVWLTSGGMFRELPDVQWPQPGDLALYGRPSTDGRGASASHVRIVERWDPQRAVAGVIGSDGGDSRVITPEIASDREAFVKRRSDHHTPRFLGFRTLSGRVATPMARPIVWYAAN